MPCFDHPGAGAGRRPARHREIFTVWARSPPVPTTPAPAPPPPPAPRSPAFPRPGRELGRRLALGPQQHREGRQLHGVASPDITSPIAQCVSSLSTDSRRQQRPEHRRPGPRHGERPTDDRDAAGAVTHRCATVSAAVTGSAGGERSRRRATSREPPVVPRPSRPAEPGSRRSRSQLPADAHPTRRLRLPSRIATSTPPASMRATTCSRCRTRPTPPGPVGPAVGRPRAHLLAYGRVLAEDEHGSRTHAAWS